MNKTVGRLRLDSADHLSDLIYVDLVRKLCPEDDAGFRIFPPDASGDFNTGKLWHLNVKDGKRRARFKCKTHGGFPIARLDKWHMGRKTLREQISQVSALGFVIFSNKNRHSVD